MTMDMHVKCISVWILCVLFGTVIHGDCTNGIWTSTSSKKLVGDDVTYSRGLTNVASPERCQEFCVGSDTTPAVLISDQPCLSYNYFSGGTNDKICDLFMKELGDPGVSLLDDATATYYQCDSVPPTEPPTTSTSTSTTSATTSTTGSAVTPPPTAAASTEASAESTEPLEVSSSTDTATTEPTEISSTTTTTATTTTEAYEGDALDWLKNNLTETVLIGMGILILLLFFVAICTICILSNKRNKRETKYY